MALPWRFMGWVNDDCSYCSASAPQGDFVDRFGDAGVCVVECSDQVIGCGSTGAGSGGGAVSGKLGVVLHPRMGARLWRAKRRGQVDLVE